eukprot:2085473-Amphidinium_carterae.1
MSTLSCPRYAARIVRTVQQRRSGLSSTAAASAAFSFTLAVFTAFLLVRPRSSSSCGTCFWSASI